MDFWTSQSNPPSAPAAPMMLEPPLRYQTEKSRPSRLGIASPSTRSPTTVMRPGEARWSSTLTQLNREGGRGSRREAPESPFESSRQKETVSCSAARPSLLPSADQRNRKQKKPATRELENPGHSCAGYYPPIL